jgi:hypothetical protein
MRIQWWDALSHAGEACRAKLGRLTLALVVGIARGLGLEFLAYLVQQVLQALGRASLPRPQGHARRVAVVHDGRGCTSVLGRGTATERNGR